MTCPDETPDLIQWEDSLNPEDTPRHRSNSFQLIFNPIYCSNDEPMPIHVTQSLAPQPSLYGRLSQEVHDIAYQSGLLTPPTHSYLTTPATQERSLSAGNTPITRRREASPNNVNGRPSAVYLPREPVEHPAVFSTNEIQDPFSIDQLERHSRCVPHDSIDGPKKESDLLDVPAVRQTVSETRKHSYGSQMNEMSKEKKREGLYPDLPTVEDDISESGPYRVLEQQANREVALFCDVIKRLRSQWPHSKAEGNPGLVLNPLVPIKSFCTDRGWDSSAKMPNAQIEIESSYLPDPFRRACDPNGVSVCELICEALIFAGAEDVRMNDFLLRIYGRSEYLHVDRPLSDQLYIQECCRQDLLVRLVLEHKDAVSKALRRTKYDDQTSFIVQSSSTASNLELFSLEQFNVYLNTVAKERIKLEKYVDERAKLKIVRVACMNVEQSLKVITTAVGGITPRELLEHLITIQSEVESIYSEGEEPVSGVRFKEHRKQLNKALNKMDKSVYSLVGMYCRLIRTDFTVAGTQLPVGRVDMGQMPADDGAGDNGSPARCSLNCPEPFMVCVDSVHRFGAEQAGRYDSIRVKVVLTYTGRPLIRYRSSTGINPMVALPSPSQQEGEAGQVSDPVKERDIHEGFHPVLYLGQWLTFPDFPICTLPRETVISFKLYGITRSQDSSNTGGRNREIRKLLGWANMPLYNASCRLSQGPQLVSLWTDTDDNAKWGSTQLNTSSNAVVLQIYLTEYFCPVEFASQELTDELDEFDMGSLSNLPSEEMAKVEAAINSLWIPDTEGTTSGQDSSSSSGRSSGSNDPGLSDLLWEHRGRLSDRPEALAPLLIATIHNWPTEVCARGWSWPKLMCSLYGLIEVWAPVGPGTTLRLLGPDVPDKGIREAAVRSLRKLVPDELQIFMPQLVECLKFDLHLNWSGLAELLIEYSMKSVQFACALYWQLKEVPLESCHSRRLQLVFEALLRCSGAGLRTVWRQQEEVVRILSTTAEAVKSTSGAEKKHEKLTERLYELFDWLVETGHNAENSVDRGFRLPYNPGLVGCKLDRKSCSFFNSNACPLRVVFHNIDKGGGALQVMFKCGDDLRRDSLVTQMIRLMDLIWLSDGLDLRMIHFRTLSTAGRKGLVELVSECSTYCQIQESQGGITAPFNERGIRNWLRSQNSTELEYKKAVENFLLTIAGCCVSTYVLGIGDRHNDNIMIRHTGHVFHIDFAKILGDVQTFVGISRDRVPFVFTMEMAYVLNDYCDDGAGTGLQRFIDICCEAYHSLRRNIYHLLPVLSLAASAGVPGVTEDSIKFFVRALRPWNNEMDATQYFTELIQKSVSSKATLWNNFIHKLNQGRNSSNTEGNLFSFTPRVITIDNSVQIETIEIMEVKKCEDPEKYYVYKVAIWRTGWRVPGYVYRRMCQFAELARRLSSRFPEGPVPGLCKPVISQESSYTEKSTSAEGGRNTLQKFVDNLLKLAKEISECDLIYTFFHSTLSDEQHTTGTQNDLNDLRHPIVNKPSRLKLRLILAEDTSKIDIQIQHAQYLRLPSGGEEPHAYVKTYLRPGQNKLSKWSSDCIHKSANPTFNKMHHYNLSPSDITNRELEIALWHKAAIRVFLGKVVIPLRTLTPGHDDTRWYDLEGAKRTRSNSATNTAARGNLDVQMQTLCGAKMV